MNTIGVALLENELPFLNLLKIGLEDHFKVWATNDTEEFIRTVKQPSILIVDYNLDFGVNGVDVMKRILQTSTLMHFIFISNQTNVPLLLELIDQGYGIFFSDKLEPDFFNGLVRKIHRAKKLLMKKIIASRNNELIGEQIDKILKSITL